MKKQLLHRVFAPMMALLLFCSSVGMNSYARWCNCKRELTVSLLTKSEGDCCKHEVQKSAHACCHLPKPEKTGCEHEEHKNCCDTEVVYEVLEVEAPLLSATADATTPFGKNSFTPLLPHSSIPQYYPQFTHLNLSHILLNDTGPPISKSGREILQQIQILRC